MFVLQNEQTAPRGIIDYIPARLTEGKEWYVSYYVTYPPTGQMRRKRIKVNRIKSVPQRRTIAREIIKRINGKLAEGWNPFVENAAPKSFHRFDAAINTYLEVQKKELEERSYKSYASFVKILLEYLGKIGRKPDMFVYQFDKSVAAEIMLAIKRNPKISPRTYNNYLMFFKSLFNWLKSFNYITANPFENLRPMPKKLTKAHKELFTPEMRRDLKEYLERESPRYLVACLLCYYCFMRPKEISWMKFGDINFKTQTIRVWEDYAKNDKTSVRTIPDVMMPYLLALDWSYPNDYFVFSGDKKGRFFAGKTHLEPIYIAKYWISVREYFGWSKKVQFYNLKHTGITNMLADGVAPNFVQGQADHQSLEMTTIYAATQTPVSQEDIRKKVSEF